MTQIQTAPILPDDDDGPSWEVCFKYGLTAAQAAALRGLSIKAASNWAWRRGLHWPDRAETRMNAVAAEMAPLPPVLPDDLDLPSCRRIWCAVLLGEWRAVFIEDRPRHGAAPWKGRGGGRNPRDMTALRWFGSRDFHMVCALAGFDGMAVLDRFRARCRERGVAA